MTDTFIDSHFTNSNNQEIALLVWQKAYNPTFLKNWPLGKIYTAAPEPKLAHEAIEQLLLTSQAKFVLFWDEQLGFPDPKLIQELSDQPMDVWHAGLKIGTNGQPLILDYIAPTWNLNKDPLPDIRAMSWRLSLRACLVRTQVFRKLGQIDLAFETLDSAGLEMGYRFIWRGVMMVNEPRLVLDQHLLCDLSNSQDSFVFIGRHYQKTWAKYVLLRKIFVSGRIFKELLAFSTANKKLASIASEIKPGKLMVRDVILDQSGHSPKISVLIPTLCRYPYLEATLKQIQTQTIHPFEIICVDQTPFDERNPELYQKFPDLNIKVIWMDEPGQCSARNAGLAEISGDLVLFLDDDILIGPKYIQSLLTAKNLYKADIVQGVWDQSTGEATSLMDRHYRMSDRFASGNGIASRQSLSKIGGFDLNYNRNYRADADFGMRLYLSGAISVITPEAKEHSLSPSTGGLKVFGAAGAMNRIKLFQPWPPITQVYYWFRYFSHNQIKEAVLLTIITMFIPNNFVHISSILEKLRFTIINLLSLPFRIIGVFRSINFAKKMIAQGPKIPPSQLIK
jgi:glycosyltransferase involved in cell wall biosynthesis